MEEFQETQLIHIKSIFLLAMKISNLFAYLHLISFWATSCQQPQPAILLGQVLFSHLGCFQY